MKSTTAPKERPLHRKFAVVKLWRHLKTAEDECIARIKTAARLLGMECVEVDFAARLLSPPFTQLTREDIDFVLHLHYETPKCYDIFSIVALWNPVEFYHLWGYRRHASHLLTHDDFVSCESPAADDQLRRLIAHSPFRDGPAFTLHHSLAEPILPPTTGQQRLFYIGINWERIKSKEGRHYELLRLLDNNNQVHIYGPREFQGIAVWEGYKNYLGPLPFDGVSIIHKIHKAGICLCLSSASHKDSELMSSRLFEGLAAGAVIVSDENPFTRRFLGDTVLYVDTRVGPEDLYERIAGHLEWIRNNSEQATEMARAAQAIFLDRFVLTKTLGALYDGLAARRQHLEDLYKPESVTAVVTVYCLMPEYSAEVLDSHLQSCEAQRYSNLDVRIVVASRDYNMFEGRILKRLSISPLGASIDTLDFNATSDMGDVPRKLGEILAELLGRCSVGEYIQILAPNEAIFSDHVVSLVRTLELAPKSHAAVADALLLHKSPTGDHGDLSQTPRTRELPECFPLGFARMLLRKSQLASNLPTVLKYLDCTGNRLLYLLGEVARSERCTATINIQHPFHEKRMDVSYQRKEELYIIDYLGEESTYGRLGLDQSPSFAVNLTDLQKLQLATDMFHLLPLPSILKRFSMRAYRAWLRFHKSTQ